MKNIQEWEKIKKQLRRMPRNGQADSIFIKINNVLDKLRPILTVVPATTPFSFDSESIGAATAALGFTPGFISYFNPLQSY